MTKVLRDVMRRDGSAASRTPWRRGWPTRRPPELLQVPLLSPILHYTGVTYDAQGRVLDAAVIHYRGDRFSFTVTLDAT